MVSMFIGCSYARNVEKGAQVGTPQQSDADVIDHPRLWCDEPHPLPVTERTLFQIKSVSKTFTGTAMMRLIDEGKVRLEAPVRTYLPEFAVRDQIASADVTVLDLLTHMGGWEGDVFDDTGEGADAVARYVANLKNVEQVAPPPR
jgi:CubicO group peptidase (beta-lactamase class C family)